VFVSSFAVVSSHDGVTQSNRSGHSGSHSAGGFSDMSFVFAEWELQCKGKVNVEVEVVRVHSTWNIMAPIVRIFAKFDI
jgi:hypothetical protein